MIYNGAYATPRPDLGAAYQEFMEDPGAWIANEVAPELPVPVQKGTMPVRTREAMLKPVDVKRAEGGGYNRVDTQAEDKAYACEEYGLEQPVDHKQRAFFKNDFDLELVTAEELAIKIKLAREIRVAAALFNASTWTGAALTTDWSGSAPWATLTSDVIAHIKAASLKVYQNTGMWPNALVVSRTTLENLLQNTKVIARFPGASIVNDQMIRANMLGVFGLEKVIVGGATKDTADEGQTFSGSEVWGDTYAMVCRVAEQGAPVNAPCVMRQPRWTVESPEELMFEMYPEPQTRKDVQRARHDVDELAMDIYQGHLLKIKA